MNNLVEKNKEESNSRARDHMANERTFLAWIRTSIAIMAFGFVVEKFALFLEQLTTLLGHPHSSFTLNSIPVNHGYTSIFAEFLIILGGLICLLAFIKYKKVEKEIEDDSYKPSILLDIMVTLSVLLIGLFLVIYLNTSI